MVKRTMDLALSAIGLIICLLFFAFISLLVKIDSPGPVFYLQERIGWKMRPFLLFKFRTMHVNADRLTAITVGARDPRITRVGYYLRKFKLDELPQLINVLRGDMSLVGPRPEVKKFVDLYNVQQQHVLSVRPGITDLASIQFRNENEMLNGKPNPVDFYIRDIMPVKLQLNLEYIQRQSLWMDFKIILKTIILVFASR